MYDCNFGGCFEVLSLNQNLPVSSMKESGWCSDGHLNLQDQFPGFLLQYVLVLILNVSYISL